MVESQDRNNVHAAVLCRRESLSARMERGFVYHIEVPTSSCMFCELYDQSGNRMYFQSQAEFEDYRHNRKNGVLVWQMRS